MKAQYIYVVLNKIYLINNLTFWRFRFILKINIFESIISIIIKKYMPILISFDKYWNQYKIKILFLFFIRLKYYFTKIPVL